MLLLTSMPGVSFFLLWGKCKSVASLVGGGLVGSRIYLPLPSLPPFVFCFWIQTTRHWSSEDHQRSGGKMADEYLKCVGEVVLTLFVLRMRDREGKTEGE